jgi:hypothetical protein
MSFQEARNWSSMLPQYTKLRLIALSLSISAVDVTDEELEQVHFNSFCFRC